MRIISAISSDQIATIRRLFREYARALDFDLCFQGFEQELADLPGRYAPPGGCLLLALSRNQPVGCVGMRGIAKGTCEMKRLYVRPSFRRHGAGRKLADAAIAAGRAAGYSRIRLDTLGSMKEALSLYRLMGFKEIAPYYPNPSSCAVFMELALTEQKPRNGSPDAASSGMRNNLAVNALPSPTESVPSRWRKEVERILITEDQIARRVAELSRQIERDYARRELVVISLLTGTVMFLADLVRHLSLPLRLDFMGVSSYGAGTESGELIFTKELRLDVRGRDVLLVDDILDTGKTLTRVMAKLQPLKPRRIRTCVLLNKAARRTEKVEADYVGFEIPDFFVVGYGLDFAERYRNLPFVGVLHPHVYQQTTRKTAEPSKAKTSRV